MPWRAPTASRQSSGRLEWRGNRRGD
jgi:hypothetical protein